MSSIAKRHGFSTADSMTSAGVSVPLKTRVQLTGKGIVDNLDIHYSYL